MASGLNKLTARGVASLSERGRYADGGGLYLQIDGKGVKQWTFRFQLTGRRSEMGLGGTDAVPLAQARKLAAQCRAEVAAGRSPLVARRAAQAAEREAAAAAEAGTGRTFRAVADATISAMAAAWRNDKHRAQWRSTLDTYAGGLIDMDVADIRTDDVLACLQPIWRDKAETASRLRGRIEAILDAARARGLIAEDRANPARWRGHLDKLLPKRTKLSRGHHAALPWRDAPEFLARLREREATAARALEFAILTAARSGEVRGMRWGEVDLAGKVWIVPAQRMKAAREHRVPLSARALEILSSKAPGERDALVFPSATGRQMSDMVFKSLFIRMNLTDVTAHGFRSTFRDWAGDATSFPREDIEAALAHRLKDKAEAAYRRGDALEKRRTLMDAWAGFLGPRDCNVVAFGALSNKSQVPLAHEDGPLAPAGAGTGSEADPPRAAEERCK